MRLSKALYAVMKAYRKSHFSAYVIKAGICKYYESEELFPRGLRTDMECVEKWGLRMGKALARLVSGMNLKRVC